MSEHVIGRVSSAGRYPTSKVRDPACSPGLESLVLTTRLPAGVGNQINDTIGVVGNQKGPVGVLYDSREAFDMRLVAVRQPGAAKLLGTEWPTLRVQTHSHDVVADGLGPVPGTAHGHEGVVAVLLRKVRPA